MWRSMELSGVREFTTIAFGRLGELICSPPTRELLNHNYRGLAIGRLPDHCSLTR